MKVLYLYTEVMGYNLPIFECLVKNYGASVDVVHWDQNKKTPFTPSASIRDVLFHPRSQFTPQGLLDFVLKLQPDLVYTSGWQDKGYRPALQKLKSLGVPIVMGLDSQWNNSLRQQLGAKLIKYIYKKRYFTYAWVPGPLQHECASRLGFEQTEIISNLLSGNNAIFSLAADSLRQEKAYSYPRKFLYVGRLTESKGLDTLMAAFKKYRAMCPRPWSIVCIGNGPLEDRLRQQPGITVEPFSDQITLAQYAQRSGALILPSLYEPWGVVVHEFAMAGLPLLLSNKVGARSQFLVEGLNGYSFKAESPEDLAAQMCKLSSIADSELIVMGGASHQLASVLSPEVSAASFMSVLGRESCA